MEELGTRFRKMANGRQGSSHIRHLFVFVNVFEISLLCCHWVVASLDRWQKFPGPNFSLLPCRPGSWKPSLCKTIAAEMIFVATEKKSFSNARAGVTKNKQNRITGSQPGLNPHFQTMISRLPKHNALQYLMFFSCSFQEIGKCKTIETKLWVKALFI